MNQTEKFTPPSDGQAIGEKAAKATVYSLLLLASVVGNTLILVVVGKNPTMRTPTNLFIVNMALSDILVPVFALPRVLVEVLSGHRSWLVAGGLGEVLCKLVYFAQDVSMTVSVQCLVLIAVDRYFAVIYPTKCAFKKSRIKFVIVSSWLLAGLLHAPYFYIFKLGNNQGNVYCVIDWSPLDSLAATRIFFICGHVLTFVLPLATIVFIYARITMRLRRQRVPGIVSLLMREMRIRRNTHVLRMAIAVVSAFFVLWTPCVIYAILVLFVVKSGAIPEWFRFLSQLLVQTNCATNFFICLIFNNTYRREFRKLFSSVLRSCCRCHPSNRIHGNPVSGSSGEGAGQTTAVHCSAEVGRGGSGAVELMPTPQSCRHY